MRAVRELASFPGARPASPGALELAAGNPLALLAGLSEDERLGAVPIERVPVPGGALLEAFEARLAALAPADLAATVVASAAVDRDAGPCSPPAGTSALRRAPWSAPRRREC